MNETTVADCNKCDPRLNRCWICGHRGPWDLIRDCDHFAAKCSHCRTSFDIGWSLEGFDIRFGWEVSTEEVNNAR